MKIAMIIDAWEPILGGGQVHVKNICEKLIKNYDCEIDLFVRSLEGDDGIKYIRDENLFNGKLKIIRCGRSKKFFNFFERIFSIFSIFFRVIKEYKTNKYDLIHAHTFLGLISGKISSILLKVPIIITIHGANLLDKGEKSFYYFIEKTLLTKIKYNTLITVGSSFLKYKNINKNIVVIGNGINISEFDNIKEKKENNIYKILFVGRLEWTKGIDTLINSIKLIDKKILDEKKVEIHLIGYGYQENEYRELINKYNLSKYIKFRGKIIGKDLINEYKSSDLFLLPSRTEGFGITILESMISKVPVISTRCGGPEDIIIDGQNGFLIEKENVNDLRNIIINFITGKISNLDKIKDNGYNTVKNNYTWDIIVYKIYNEYEKIRGSL